MIITKTYHPVVHAATLKSVTQDDASKDPYSTAAAATSSALATVAPTPVSTDASDKQQAYEEAFARMQVQMQTVATSASSTSASTSTGVSSTSSSTDALAASDASGMTSTRKAFMDYMQETPAQKTQDSILQQMGLTKDEFDKLPAGQKDAVQKEIAQRMKDESQTGGSPNVAETTATAA